MRFVCGINSALVSRRHTPSFNSNSGAPPRIWTLLATLREKFYDEHHRVVGAAGWGDRGVSPYSVLHTAVRVLLVQYGA